jgi:hypothetical protein
MCNNNGSPTPHKTEKNALNLSLHKKDSEIQIKSRFLPPPMNMVHVMRFVELLRQLLARISFSCDDIMTTQQLCTNTIQYMKCKFYTVPPVKEEKFFC